MDLTLENMHLDDTQIINDKLSKLSYLKYYNEINGFVYENDFLVVYNEYIKRQNYQNVENVEIDVYDVIKDLINNKILNYHNYKELFSIITSNAFTFKIYLFKK